MISRKSPNRVRRAFTLFEVILAIALSTLLLMLIGMAINLYLVHMEARRNDVEWAQLARSVFKMIGDDLRAASEYKPQDMSGALAAVSSSLSTALTSGTGTTGTATAGSGSASSGSTASGSTGTTSSQMTSSGTSTSGSTSTGTGTNTSTSSTSDTSATGDTTGSSLLTTPGVHGTLDEVIIDASRPLRFDEIFSSVSGYSGVNAPVETGPDALMKGTSGRLARSDLKTVRYFIRQGEAINPSSVAATTLTPASQLHGAGLVRQEMDRAQRVSAEQMGDQGTLELGQRLIAPEVVYMEIRYFDGTEWLDTWDMQTNGGLPPAVEVRLRIADPELVNATGATGGFGGQSVMDNSREFRQKIYLPQAKPPSTSTSTSTSTTDTSSSTGTTSSTGTSTAGGSTP